jgi:hypothetical protein
MVIQLLLKMAVKAEMAVKVVMQVTAATAAMQ